MKNLIFFLFINACLSEEITRNISESEDLILPEGFILGASTASYQIEGGWNEDGKGESIWDRNLHLKPDWVADKSNGDIAADSYHKFEEDIIAAKQLKLQMYRLSVSWPRVLPTGDITQINEKGIAYYSHLIDRLLEEKIEPLVTLYHWDLPQFLQENIGGWANPVLADYFEDYAHLIFLRLGNRVKYWITINEPGEVCRSYAYSTYPPGLYNPGIAEYRCAHTILLAHARAYRLYQRNFRYFQKGQISISISSRWLEPKTTSQLDLEAVRVRFDFDYGWFSHPIFSKLGNYPQSMRDRVANNSFNEGRYRSRLPEFTAAELNLVHRSADFIALNHYTTRLVSFGEEGIVPSKDWDSGTRLEIDPNWPKSYAPWLGAIVPWGFGKLLVKIAEIYPNWRILVTENGFADKGELKDSGRCRFIISYMRSMLLAMQEKAVPVFGYVHWSLIDNFEWIDGYRYKFGLFYVDFKSPNRTRIIKESAKLYANISSSRIVPSLDNF